MTDYKTYQKERNISDDGSLRLDSNPSERKLLNSNAHSSNNTTTLDPAATSDPPSSSSSSNTRWCMDCNKKFTSVQRKHRCRICNNVFCADCAPRRQQTGEKNGSNRVCHSCLPRVQATVWVDDTVAQYCMNKTCGKAFTGIRRRHHCRVCGLIFCLDCCPKQMKGTLPRTGVALEGHSRACLSCLGYTDGLISSSNNSGNNVCSKCTSKFSVTKRRHHCRRCDGVFCSECCPKSLGESERVCAECKAQDKLSDGEVLKRFEILVVGPSLRPHIQTGLRELPLLTKRALVSLHAQNPHEPSFVLADDPSFWGCILGTESKAPASPPTATQLQRLRLLLAAAEDSWVEDLIDLTGLSPLTSLLASPDLSLQISALACITGLATTRTGLQAVVTSSELAEAVVTMLLRATNSVKIACLDLLTLLCWSSPQGRQAVVEGFGIYPPKYRVLVECLHPSPLGGAPFADIKLLLATLLFINVIISTVTVTPDQQETLAQQLLVHQEFQQVGLDLNVISQLEDLCAEHNPKRHEPIYELQIQCNAFRAKYRQRQETAAKTEAEGGRTDKSARSARAQMMKKLDSKGKGRRSQSSSDAAFLLAECRHTSLASLVQGMLRRTPRNIHVLSLLQTIERRKRGADKPSAETLDMFALEEFSSLFYCHSKDKSGKWKCACAEGDDCSKDGQSDSDNSSSGSGNINSNSNSGGGGGSSSSGANDVNDPSFTQVSGSLVPNECFICVMKCFLNEGGLTYLHTWFLKELDIPWSPPPVPPSVSSSLPAFAGFATLLPSISAYASSSPFTRTTILKLTNIFWSFASLLDMNVLPSCQAFSSASHSSPLSIPQEQPHDANNRWISVMIRTAPLSSIRLLSRGALLAWLSRVSSKHIASHTLNPCILEAFVTLLTTGDIFPTSNNNSNNNANNNNVVNINFSDNSSSGNSSSSNNSNDDSSITRRDRSPLACPSAIPFVLAVLPAIATDISVDVLRGVLPLLPSNLEEAGKALPLLLQTLPSFSEAVRVECLRELVALVNKNATVALACTADHPRWLEHLHALVAASPEKGGGGAAGVFELALGFMGMVLHRHFMGAPALVSFTQMFVDALYGCGVIMEDEKKGEASRHVWSLSAIELCRRIIESFVSFTSKNNLTQWKGNYSHPAWPNCLAFFTLIKRLCIHNTRSPDFLSASHFSPATPSPQTVELVSENALYSLWKLTESLNLESSGDEVAVFGMEAEEAKRTFTMREEARFLMDFFRNRYHSGISAITSSIGVMSMTKLEPIDEEVLLDRVPWSSVSGLSTPRGPRSSPLPPLSLEGSGTMIYTLDPEQTAQFNTSWLPSKPLLASPKPPPRPPQTPKSPPPPPAIIEASPKVEPLPVNRAVGSKDITKAFTSSPESGKVVSPPPPPAIKDIPKSSQPSMESIKVADKDVLKSSELNNTESKRVSKLVERFESSTHYYQSAENSGPPVRLDAQTGNSSIKSPTPAVARVPAPVR